MNRPGGKVFKNVILSNKSKIKSMRQITLKLLVLTLLLGYSFNTWGQTLELTGKVLDDQGISMPGVSVFVTFMEK